MDSAIDLPLFKAGIDKKTGNYFDMETGRISIAATTIINITELLKS
jgi:hypothetical protein